MVRNARKKLAGWQGELFDDVFSMWKRKPNSHDKQNSLLHRCDSRVALTGSM